MASHFRPTFWPSTLPWRLPEQGVNKAADLPWWHGEVRSLAQRSAAAAKEIKTLIGASVDEVNKVLVWSVMQAPR